MERHYRPASGSCPRCQAALDLASVKAHGVWYCGAACASGHPADAPPPAVPEEWLTPRPRRFLRRRLPKELNAATPRRRAERP